MSIAHNAALQAAAAALAAVGYCVRKEGQHYRLLQSLAFTIKTDPATIEQLDKFRQKRNISDYERAGLVSEQEAEEQEAKEMIALAKQLRHDVEQWLRAYHPRLDMAGLCRCGLAACGVTTPPTNALPCF